MINSLKVPDTRVDVKYRLSLLNLAEEIYKNAKFWHSK